MMLRPPPLKVNDLQFARMCVLARLAGLLLHKKEMGARLQPIRPQDGLWNRSRDHTRAIIDTRSPELTSNAGRGSCCMTLGLSCLQQSEKAEDFGCHAGGAMSISREHRHERCWSRIWQSLRPPSRRLP